MMFDRLYELSETAQVQFIGYASEKTRYDFAIVYTDRFFGKPMVVCMQTGHSSLLCQDDARQVEFLQRQFRIRKREEAEELSLFLRHRLPPVPAREQYEEPS